VFHPTLSMVLIAHRHPDNTRLVFWCAVGFCAGIYLFCRGFQLLERRRLILDTPVSKIRSAAMGMVEISGLAVGPYTMIAPVTARPCYYFRTIVWEWKQRGRSKQWVKVAAECMHVPFFVDDNSGRMMVDPRGAELELHRDFQQEFCDSFFTTKDPAPDNVRTFLARHGIATNNKIKVEEFCIKPKNSLFILGTLAENPGIAVSTQPVRDEEASSVSSSVGGGSSRLSMNKTEAFSGGDQQLSGGTLAPPSAMAAAARSPLYIHLGTPSGAANSTDSRQQQKIAAALIKAGISNPSAWSAAGLVGGAAGVQVVADLIPELSGAPANAADSLDGFDPHPPVVLMKGVANKTFLISWRSQQEVARSLGWKCTLMIWGGPLLSLFCLYIILSVENLL
jgi:E3 Ubiquitin ligase